MPSWKIACVPMRISIFPFSRSSIISFLSFDLVDPVSKQTLIPIFSNHPLNEEKCCSASISVGHRRAVCQLLDFACKAAKAPIRVFPDPTSPCSNLLIGTSAIRSSLISSQTLFCALVKLNGKELKKVA